MDDDQTIFANSVEPSGRYGAVFEGDVDVGWVYFHDMAAPNGGRIVHAIRVYRGAPSFDPESCAVLWSDDGTRAGLRIGDRVCSVYDFRSKRAAGGLIGDPEAPEVPRELVDGLS